MDIQAPWVGKTPEEYRGEKEYTILFTLQGSITISAIDKEDAREQFKEMSYRELAGFVEDKQIDDVE